MAGIWPVFPNGDDIDFRRIFILTAVQPLIGDRTRWTGLRHVNEMFDRICFRVQPGAFHVGQEHPGGRQHTLSRMNTTVDVKADRDVLSRGFVVRLPGDQG